MRFVQVSERGKKMRMSIDCLLRKEHLDDAGDARRLLMLVDLDLASGLTQVSSRDVGGDAGLELVSVVFGEATPDLGKPIGAARVNDLLRRAIVAGRGERSVVRVAEERSRVVRRVSGDLGNLCALYKRRLERAYILSRTRSDDLCKAVHIEIAVVETERIL